MKNFIYKIIILLFTYVVFMTVIFFFLPYDINSYYKSIEKKYDRMQYLTNNNFKKIIFVGGSNLAFGLNSEEIEKKTGFHVVNMSLHAGLGLDLMLNQVIEYIHEGDIVVISPEYNLFLDDDYYGDGKILSEYFIAEKKEIKLMNSRNYIHTIKNINNAIIASIKYTIKKIIQLFYKDFTLDKYNIYRASNFNKYGDMTAHIGKKTPDYFSGGASFFEGEINLESINKIKKFQNVAKKQGTITLITWPCILDKTYKINKEKFDEIVSLVSKYCLNIISDKNTYIYSYELFYDTTYHLNKDGIEVRTKSIIKDINNYINKNN